MWMMGCNDGGEICLPTNNDSFSRGRKLRLLIPKLSPNRNTNSPNHHQHHRHHGCGYSNHHRNPDDLGVFALNHHHHLATMAEQSKREFNAAHQVVVSSRWNPTPEQLRALEEMYRRGTRTPSADQIQQITSQLRLYGKIEGKNVFYWFQNHKARERQKRCRQMESCGRAEVEKGHLNNHCEMGNLQCKESGACCKTASDDVQRANNNNNNTPSDNSNSNNSYNWETAKRSNMDKGGKSAMAAVGGGSASVSSSATAVKGTSTLSASSTAVVTSLWMKLNATRELLLPNSNHFITGNSMTNYDNLGRNATCPRLLSPPGPVALPTSTTSGCTILTSLNSSSPPLPFPSQDFQTLQLFPLRSEEHGEDPVCYVGEDDHLRRQFFEFLPMKN